ncbi:hypothetical protein AArcS_0436 [Natranaeroarchaeum sulfidigenes]|uniref:Uncharacterized protein n=1 Tax=Natranaeroarchaeum sulfidigenes TaxID=2784880 RepID=A0A897MTW2_9EURY|nr:hypothetical protein AArcS_0436 [Natranaeroarchaeum sulfidigenes]
MNIAGTAYHNAFTRSHGICGYKWQVAALQAGRSPVPNYNSRLPILSLVTPDQPEVYQCLRM